MVAAAVDAAGRVINARDFGGRGLRLYPVGLKADTISRIQPALVALGAAGMVLIFMLMVNLASVLLARVSQREHELAVSRALGANTAAIVRSTLLEGGMLGSAGGALGALVASWGTKALVALAPFDLPRREAIVDRLAHRRCRHHGRLPAWHTRRGGARGLGCADLVIVPAGGQFGARRRRTEPLAPRHDRRRK